MLQTSAAINTCVTPSQHKARTQSYQSGHLNASYINDPLSQDHGNRRHERSKRVLTSRNQRLNLQHPKKLRSDDGFCGLQIDSMTKYTSQAALDQDTLGGGACEEGGNCKRDGGGRHMAAELVIGRRRTEYVYSPGLMRYSGRWALLQLSLPPQGM